MNLVTTFRPLLHLSFQVLMLVPVVAGYGQNLSALAIACDRYITSDRAEAAVVSAVLQDIGVYHQWTYPVYTIHCIDKNKVRRERIRKRVELQKGQKQRAFFDGREEKTKVIRKEGVRFHRQCVTKEYLSLIIIINKARRTFGHVTPKGGSAWCLKSSIVEYLSENHISAEKLLAVGCDSTNVNTGRVG